jgi:hypothetical protein
MLLSKNPIHVAEMGGRARAMLDASFARRQALARWQDLLTALLKGDAPETELPVTAS